MLTPQTIPTPCYLIYEERLRSNLRLISDVSRRSGAKIIMAFKANAVWRTFDIIGEYCRDFTASSLNELELGNTTLGGDAHSYCPAYTDDTIEKYIAGSTHITFNSLDQARRFAPKALAAVVSTGLRVNPQCSVIETDIYNPALPGSRFGVTADHIGDCLPDYIEGLHFHALCESSSHDLKKVLKAFEDQFGHLLPQVKWVNMGGGHLVKLLTEFRKRYPWLEVILEPGSAFTWRTGDLLASVVDVVENQGIKTAIIDASFACHMPDCLEMPYKPTITESVDAAEGLPSYRIGGNSCLSGDFMGDWSFTQALKQGDRLTFEDMNHYTTVKTNMFNGIAHPSIALARSDGKVEYLRQYDFSDYKSRMC